MVGAGLWRLPLSSNPRHHLHQRLYTIYSIAIQIIFVLNIPSMIYRIIQLFSEAALEDLYLHLTLVFLVMEITYKVLIYLKARIPHMFATIVEREEALLAGQDQQERHIYFAAVRYCKLAIFSQCFCIGSGIVWFMGINIYKKYIQGLQENEHFMYQIWFPFDENKHDSFVTCYNIFIALYGFVFGSASASPLQSLMVFSVSQLRVLQLNIRRTVQENSSPTQLHGLVKEHQFLIQ